MGSPGRDARAIITQTAYHCADKTVKTTHSLLLLALGLAAAGSAPAQQAQPLFGSWTLVSSSTETGGKKVPTFGQSPRGTLIFAADGHYALIMSRASLPKFTSNSRDRGTDDENRAIVAGSLAHAGRYTVNEKEGTLTWQIESSTFPNWANTSQTHAYRVVGDELRYINPGATAAGSAFETVWKRAR
jgi:hypothetical protein